MQLFHVVGCGVARQGTARFGEVRFGLEFLHRKAALMVALALGLGILIGLAVGLVVWGVRRA